MRPSSPSRVAWIVSWRVPSLASSGPTTPSRCWSSASSKCSGSIAWCSCRWASVCAASTASRALTVNLSNLGAIFSLTHVRARIVAAQRLQFFVQLTLRRRRARRHDDLRAHELVAGAPALDARHAVAGQPECPAARGARRHLHRDLSPEGRHLHAGAQHGLGRRDRQLEVDVVALALEERMRRDGDNQVEIAAATGGGGAFAGDPNPLARANTRRDLHVERARHAVPAAAVARRARLSVHVAGAVAGRTRLVELHREALQCSGVRLLERDLDGGLHVLAANRAPAPAARTETAAPQQVLDVETTAAPRPRATAAHAGAQIPEDRAEEVREVFGVAAAVLDTEAASRRTARRRLREALPVGTERVVSPPLLGVGEDLVGLVDLLEAVRRVLALGDVRMVLARELAVGGLQRLVVGLPVDAEDLVVVLVLDSHPKRSVADGFGVAAQRPPRRRGVRFAGANPKLGGRYRKGGEAPLRGFRAPVSPAQIEALRG